MIQNIPFVHDNKRYEVRVTCDGETVRIRAFFQGRPANGYTYSVSLPTCRDIEDALGTDAIKELIRTAKEDVTSGAWERLCAILEDNSTKEPQ